MRHAMVWSQHEELWAFWGHHLQYCILIVLASLVNSDMIRLFLRNVRNMGGVDRSCDQRFCDGQSLEPMLFDFTYVVDQGDSFVQTSMLQQRGLLSCLKLQACDCNFCQLCADLEQHLHRCNLRLFLILIMVIIMCFVFVCFCLQYFACPNVLQFLWIQIYWNDDCLSV